MHHEPNPNTVPLHVVLRRRRHELCLLQTELAEALSVTPECVGQWECGRRRMCLDKLPCIAEVLRMNPKAVCMAALAEFHPGFHAALFGQREQQADAAA